MRPDTTPPASCSAPEYRQFDFFLGDWETYDLGAPDRLIARNRVTRMVGGCALREVYEQNDGLEGGRMILTATEHDANGTSSLLRGVWWREGATVRERAERSRDNGATWAPVFDIVFRSRGPAGPPSQRGGTGPARDPGRR
jgi:hypothetical protein